ncbi:MAG: HEAT repeat domain-containing protein [Chitinispirillaceae bacterium]|nr:HEAT repeat domain-containing protein [Chitinispirillaceae bacterium]
MMHRVILLSVIGMFLVLNGCSPYRKHISTLRSSDVEARRNAAFKLSTFEKLDEKLLPKLLEAFEDNDPLVREFTIKAIGKMGPRTDGVPQAIKNGLRDPDLSVRRASAAIFSTMNPVPSEILFTLAESLGDKDSLLRSFVRSTFIDLGPIGVNALVRICQSGNVDLRCLAVTTLGTIGCEAKRALPTLKELLNDTNDQVRTAAQQSIERIQYSFFCPSQSSSQ